jgi:hypothetical protein
MKYLIIVFSLFSFLDIYAQGCDSCGLDNNPILNKSESEFLNEYLKDKRGDFDFADKKIIFITGSNASTKGFKRDYFKNVFKWSTDSNSKISTELVILSAQNKIESGGYDAILTYWSMVSINNEKKIQKIIKMITI